MQTQQPSALQALSQLQLAPRQARALACACVRQWRLNAAGFKPNGARLAGSVLAAKVSLNCAWASELWEWFRWSLAFSRFAAVESIVNAMFAECTKEHVAATVQDGRIGPSIQEFVTEGNQQLQGGFETESANRSVELGGRGAEHAPQQVVCQ